jgi:hypothetical protein
VSIVRWNLKEAEGEKMVVTNRNGIEGSLERGMQQ